MEINITKYFEFAEHAYISGSAFELGENAAHITWNNAKQAVAEFNMLDTEEKLQDMRDYARETGGWNAEEIAAWSDVELNALFNQLVSGEVRQIEDLCSDEDGEIDWKEYERLANKGTLSGSLYRGDDKQIYYYLGM